MTVKVANMQDVETVRRVLENSGGPAEKADDLCSTEGVMVLMPNSGTVFIVFPVNKDICSGHVYVEKPYRGRAAVESERKALKWIIENTDFKAVVGFTPEAMTNVIDFHRRVGMRELGRIGGNVVFCYDGGE